VLDLYRFQKVENIINIIFYLILQNMAEKMSMKKYKYTICIKHKVPDNIYLDLITV
jgi:hypothetical protein